MPTDANLELVTLPMWDVGRAKCFYQSRED